MVNYWHDIELWAKPELEVNAVVEVVKGDVKKFEFQKKTGLIKLDRILPSRFHFPEDYGFLPRTLMDDGDALDVLVITKEPEYPTAVLRVRPIGVMRLIDSGKRDDKIIAVHAGVKADEKLQDIGNLPIKMISRIEEFFKHYKDYAGQKVEVVGLEGRPAAIETIKSAELKYKKKFKKQDL